MTIISVDSISKHYGPRVLFSDVSFGLARGERLGVIGVNGSGKSTLLRIVAGLETPDSGQVVTTNNAHIAYLAQAPAFPDEQTVFEAVYGGDSPTLRLLREYEALSLQLEQRPNDALLLERLSVLTPQMDALGAWDAEAAARSIISELGLHDLIHDPIGTLSGGQRKRVAMARALVDTPDLLILDEPTNHIDLDTITWLEEYLARTNLALLLVTHDRYFLDRLVTRMLELDRGSLYSYEGNYERFLEQKDERLSREAAAADAHQNLLRRELAWLRRGARARTTKQKAHVERVHALMDQRAPTAQGTVEIDLSGGRRLGKRVVELKAVSKGYGERRLIRQFSTEIRPGDRVGIIGPNGSGKSTLLNLITGRLTPDSGELVIGETVHIAYYDQEAEGLDPSMRVVDYIREAAELVRGREGALVAATSMLERFLFTPEQQWAYISTLSGGERRRLYLLRQLIGMPNLLILDEPTNDLDLQTLGVLENYLDDFQGAVIVVSHDRYFLDRVVQRTFAFEGEGQIREYPGGYSYYVQYRPPPAPVEKEKLKPTPQSLPQPTPDRPRRLNSKEKRELAQLEKKISELEAAHARIGAALNGGDGDYTRYAALADELAQVEQQLEQAFERWTELAEIEG